MTKNKTRFQFFWLLVSLVSWMGTAQAGDLKGRIVGSAPKADAAVIWVGGLSGGSVPQRDTVITHLPGGKLDPATGIGFVGNDFVLRNQDNALHTTHLYLHLAYQKSLSSRPLVNGATLYNIAFPRAGMEVRRPIRQYFEYRDETGFIEVKCNPHPNERAVVLVFDHPYAAVADGEGRFSIPQVPGGRHQVWIWHAGAAALWRTVDVDARAPTDIVIDVAKTRPAK